MEVRAPPFQQDFTYAPQLKKGLCLAGKPRFHQEKDLLLSRLCDSSRVFLPSSLISLSQGSELIAPFWPGKPCQGELPASPMPARCTHSGPLTRFTCTISAPKIHATPQKVLLTIEPNHAEYDNAKGYINMPQQISPVESCPCSVLHAHFLRRLL